jgi:hypothetical protein
MSNLLEQASLVMIPSGYAEDIVYSEIPLDGSGDLQLTRASNGTRVNSAGLVEVCPWNLLTYSEEFNNAIWTKITASVTANTTTAPNGTLTADSLIANVAVYGLVQQTANITANVPNTFSVYAKYNGISIFQLQTRDNANNANNAYVVFDILTGVVSAAPLASGAYSNASATIESVGNGWYRLSLTSTSNISVTSRFRLVSDLSDGINGYFIWGAQLNEGSSAKPYFPTTDRLNVPRLTYQNGGGGCPSLLLEPQRTNLFLQSEDISSASWLKNNSPVITSNIAVSPDGTTSADGIKSDTASVFQTINQNIIVSANATISTSVFVKKEISETFFGGFACIFSGGTTKILRVVVNAVSGTASVTSDSTLSATTKVEDYGTYWRVSATATDNGSNSLLAYNYYGTISTNGTTTNTGVGSVRTVWGFQLEAGAYPTTYIPTTTASATRVADSFSRNNIYTNGLITSSGGTWFVELLNNVALTADATIKSLSIGDTDLGTNNAINIINSPIQIRTRVAGVGIGNTYTTTSSSLVKIAIKWNGTTIDYFVNGVKVLTGGSFAITNMNFLDAVGNNTPKLISQMDLFPTPLTDAECIALTTI